MRRGRHIVVLSVCLTLAVTAPVVAAKRFSIDTTPVKNGRVFVDGRFVGVAPVTVELKLRKSEVARVTAEKVGALGLWERQITKDEKGTVYVRLEEDEALTQTIESDVANTWLTITPKVTRGPNDSVNEDAVWQRIVSVVTDNYADLEQLDRSSFYLRTAWRVRRFPHSVLRNRLVVKRGVTDQLSVKVQLESFAMISPEIHAELQDDLFARTSRILADDKETIDYLRDQL